MTSLEWLKLKSFVKCSTSQRELSALWAMLDMEEGRVSTGAIAKSIVNS